jgi:hypothetical protein
MIRRRVEVCGRSRIILNTDETEQGLRPKRNMLSHCLLNFSVVGYFR